MERDQWEKKVLKTLEAISTKLDTVHDDLENVVSELKLEETTLEQLVAETKGENATEIAKAGVQPAATE